MKLNFAQTVLLLFTVAMIIGCATTRPNIFQLNDWAKDWCKEHNGLNYLKYKPYHFEIRCKDGSGIYSDGDLKDLVQKYP